MALVEPMLATTRPVAEVPDGWVVEPKLDGWRAIVSVGGGRLTVRSRRGNDLTDRLAELAPLVGVLPEGTVLDGELVAGAGRMSDFYGLAPRLLARSGAARERWSGVVVSLHLFDVLEHGGTDLCGAPWYERREVLESLALQGRRWATVPLLDGRLHDLLAACARLDLEGVVLKRRSGVYRRGERTRDWVKVKTPGWHAHHAARRRDG